MVLFNILLVFLSLAGYCYYFYAKKIVSPLSLPLLVTSVLIIQNYIFGVLGYLSIGYYFSILVGLVLLVICLYNKYPVVMLTKKSEILSLILCLVPFAVCAHSIQSDFNFTQWDEFSFWAISTKFIYPNNSLYTADSGIIFKSYPPAQQLLHYFVVKTLGWKESYILVSQVCFILFCILSATGQLIRNKVAASIVFVSLIPLLNYFNFGLSTVYVDPLLSVYFAATIALCIKADNKISQLIPCTIFIFTLVILKQIGLILALISILVFLSSRITTSLTKKDFKRIALLCGVLLASLILSYKSWSMYTTSIGASVHINLPSFKDFFTNPLLSRFGETIFNFLDRVSDPKYLITSKEGYGLSLTSLFAIVFCFFIASCLLCKKDRLLPLVLNSTILISGFFVYNLFLVFCYLTIFTEYEGRNLASFYRYSGTYTMAVLIVAVCVLIDSFEDRLKNISIAAAIIVSTVIFICAPNAFYEEASNISGSPGGRAVRMKVRTLSDIIIKDAKNGDATSYFISQDSTGFEKYVFNYEIMPHKSVWWCWSIGAKYNESDVWTCNDDLVKLTQGYSYIAIYHADKQFWDLAKQYLTKSSSEKEFGVYKIDRNKGKYSLIEIK